MFSIQIEREHHWSESNSNVLEKPTILANNNRTLLLGLRNVVKIYYIIKIREKRHNKGPVFLITRSPNQYPNYKRDTEIDSID